MLELPLRTPAMYDNGIRSSEAEIDPRRGITGVILLRSNFIMPLIIFN